VPATSSPTGRAGHAMVYDAGGDRIVLFGGETDANEVLNDSWEWDGTDWAQITPTASPSPRRGPAMAYDAARARIVLFGGSSTIGSSPIGDTWEWDGADWIEIAAASLPLLRASHALAYDTARGRVVLVGCRNAAGGELDDTWEWDGTAWSQLSPATSPPPRFFHSMVYDTARERTVLFAGVDASP